MSASETNATKKIWLGSRNYVAWHYWVEGQLMEKGLRRLALGEVTGPVIPGENSSLAEIDRYEAWQEKREKAAGLIWNSLEAAQQTTVYHHRTDPVKLLEELKIKHWPTSAVDYRLRAIEAMLNLEFAEETKESLQGYLERVKGAMNRDINSFPEGYSTTQLMEDLAAITLLNGLPKQFSATKTILRQGGFTSL